MLAALHIENIAVIKDLDLDFSPGLTVLTGETGAGKSIIIGSVKMLLGARADRDMIRAGEEKAYVEGLFTDIDENTQKALCEIGVPPDENRELLLSRAVNADGKSVCRINRRAVPLSQMKAAGTLLIGIHGQHDTQTLLREDTHLSLLDRYGDCREQCERYAAAYESSLALKRELTSMMREEEQIKDNEEKYRRACREISEAKIKAGEDEALETKKKLVRDAQKLSKQARIVYRALYKNEKGSSAYDLMEIAQTALEQLSDALPESGDSVARLTACRAELEEIAESAKAVMEIGGENPTEELNRIEDRLELLRDLKKRYGGSLEEVLAYGERAKTWLEENEGRESRLKKLREDLEGAVGKARTEAAKLGEERSKAAAKLEKTVNEQIGYLDLSKVVFKVEVTEEQTPSGAPKLTATGSNAVRFLISANPGEPPKPISEIASGGELSRIMLALKVALSDKELTPSLVFDEIDTGISGKTSQKIGFKLRQISACTQVFCVTHSAQLASCGHHHLKISKTEVGGRNQTTVEELEDAGRVEELARIMGGIHVTETVRASARELLADGQK